jgi:DNA processing protein
MHQQKYWIGFNRVKGIGSSRLRGLWAYFNRDLEAAWNADSADLLAAGIGEKALAAFLNFRAQADLDENLAALRQFGARICTLDDDDYPTLLKEIPDAPPMFYLRGDLSSEDDLALAIVGTRRATHYGREIAWQMATAMAQVGVTVVSGLARGLDTTAHEAALAARGRTIAVLGNGIDRVYPPENRELAAAIIKRGQGALLTEHAPGTPPDARNFPARNRIISGLALGVLIVEAPRGSGALLTADCAGEQGREVFAIPGNITSPNCQGTNALIQEGAKLVTCPEDILEELKLNRYTAQTRQVVKSIAPESPDELRLLKLIALEPLHVDEISVKSGLTIKDVSAMLAIMELKGLVEATGVMTYTVSDRVDPRLIDG